MWVDEEGRLHSAAIPIETVETVVPDALRATLAEALSQFDPWREGGIGEGLLEAVENGEFGSAEEERTYEAEPVPLSVLEALRWQAITDAASAESVLHEVSPRWRLDVADVFEDLAD